MKIMSLDQSSVRSGVAVFEGSDLIHHGVIDLHKETDAVVRIQTMCSRIRDEIKKYKPNVLVLEDVNLRNGSVRTVIMLARLSGNIQEMAFEANIPYIFYSPSTWRRIAGIRMGKDIKRPQLKQEAIDFVYNAYGFCCGDDEAEAIVEGLAYLKENNLLPKESFALNAGFLDEVVVKKEQPKKDKRRKSNNGKGKKEQSGNDCTT